MFVVEDLFFENFSDKKIVNWNVVIGQEKEKRKVSRAVIKFNIVFQYIVYVAIG